MKKIYIIILIATLVFIGYLTYNKTAFLNVTVKLNDAEPFDRQLKVYFKGFKTGKSVKIYPDKNYQNTYVDIKLSPKNISLPNNVTAKFEKKDGVPFINIILPEDASVVRLKEGDVITGIQNPGFGELINEKISGDTVDSIISGASGVLDSANRTLNELENVFSQVNGILFDVRTDIKATSNALAQTSKNLASVSSKLDNGIKQDSVDLSFENIKEITNNLESATEQIDKVTIPEINSVLCNTNEIMKNTKEITGGIKNTLKKNMGFIRLIFGKPVSGKIENNCRIYKPIENCRD